MPKPSQQKFLLCLFLAIVTLALYWPAGKHDFINYDDPDYVSANPVVQQGLTWLGIQWAFTTTHSYNWHPLTWISHMADVHLFGMEPGAHHLASVVLHIVNTILLFLLLCRVTKSPWPSAFVAGAFAWHPLHVESVAWACERKDVLSTCFWMLTLLAYVRYAEGKGQKAAGSTRRYYVLTILCFALGLMSKPMLVTLPFVLLLLDAWPLRRLALQANQKSGAKARNGTFPFVRLLAEKWPLFALSIVSCVVTFLAQRREGAVVALEHLPLADRIANAVVSYVRYLGKTLWPTDLVIFYEPVASWSVLTVSGAIVVLALVSTLVIWQWRERPYLALGWCWFLGTLVPVIGVVQVGMQSMADRYMYVPMIGLLIALAWALAELKKFSPRLPAAIAVSALLVCVVMTNRTLPHWKNSETVFKHVLSVYPDHVMAHVMLGNAYVEQQRFDEGIGHFREALARQPEFAEVHFNLANVLIHQKKIVPAIEAYELALRFKPNYADAHANLAVALGMAGRLNDAVDHYHESLRITPDSPDILRNLAIDLTTLRRFDEAAVHLQRAVQVNPSDAVAHMLLGDVLAAQNGWVDAAGHYQRAIQINPHFEEARRKLAAVSDHLQGSAP